MAAALVIAYGVFAALSVLIWVLSDSVNITVDSDTIIGD